MGDGGFGGVVGWPRIQLFEGRRGEGRGRDGEALTYSGFQGIPDPALVGGAGEKPLQASGSPLYFS